MLHVSDGPGVSLEALMTKIQKFVITDHLKDSRSIVGYLDACLEEGGQPLFLEALGEVNKTVGGIATVTQTVSPPTTRE